MARSSHRDDKGEEFTFSPLFDLIAAQYGLVTAAVYGVVHRHCQMRDGVCRASTRRMAQLIGVGFGHHHSAPASACGGWPPGRPHA